MNWFWKLREWLIRFSQGHHYQAMFRLAIYEMRGAKTRAELVQARINVRFYYDQRNIARRKRKAVYFNRNLGRGFALFG